MKKTITLALVTMLTISSVFAKENTTVKGDNVSVTYGQPAKGGRVVFGNADVNPKIPFGTLWTPAEGGTAAEITVAKDCFVGGNKLPLKAGRYTLFAKPYGGEWIFIFNSALHQNGTADFEKNKSKNVVQTWALIKHIATPVEKFTITPQAEGLQMQWDDVSLVLPISFAN